MALLFAVIFLFANPLVTRVREKSDDIQKKILDNKIDKERIGRISEIEETSKIIDERSGEINIILDLKDEVEFIKKLEGIAEQTGNKMILNVDDQKSQAAVVSKNKNDAKRSILSGLSYDSYINMRINLEGNYSELINFINKLENFKYYVNVISLETKKSVEIMEKEATAEVPLNGDIFSAPGAGIDQKNILQEKISKKEKDILSSTINIVVYTKK